MLTRSSERTNCRPYCSRGRDSSFFFALFQSAQANSRTAESVTSSLITILYEEPHFLLVNKPAGLLTQAVPGIESLETRLVQQIKDRDSHSGKPFVGLPHRLDRGTSGIVLIARNQRALSRFGDQFHHRLVQKFYLAWVEGELPQEQEQRWSDYIRKITDQPKAEIVTQEAEGAKLAEMCVTRLAVAEGQSLALVKLLTGRMHQIRLQFSGRGFAVVGDEMYGSSLLLSDDPDPRQRPHGLHALRLEFRHPQTAIPLAATASLPEYWQRNAHLYEAAQTLAARSQTELRTAWR